MSSKIQPDTLAKNELEQVAQNLTPWLDTVTVEKLITAAGGADSSKDKPVAKIHGLVNAMSRAAAPPSFVLEETFALYRLGAKSIADAIGTDKDINELAVNTSRWHHQIKVDRQPVAFARTCVSGEAKGYDICQFFVSDVSGAIDSAIAWIDEYEADHPEYAETEPLVRLLVVPAYNVLAFWLLQQKTGQSDLLVIDALPELEGLKGNQLLNSAEFLKAFEGHSPIAGVTFDEDDADPLEESVADTGSNSQLSDALIESTYLEGDNKMPDLEDNAPQPPNPDDAEVASDKIIFDIPAAQDETPLFLGFIYSATRSKGFIEEGQRPESEGGPGEPLYSAYVFPYVPPEKPEGADDDPKAAAAEQQKEQPLFVAYVFPYLEPSEVELGGGKPGGIAALGGGHAGQTLFYGRIKPFVVEKSDDDAEGGDNA